MSDFTSRISLKSFCKILNWIKRDSLIFQLNDLGYGLKERCITNIPVTHYYVL